MLQEVLSDYNLIYDQLKFELINNGLINKTWLVKNGRKNYILQRVNDNIFKTPEAIASNVRKIADYLKLHYPDYLFVAPE
ncbi:MAG: aminoglycoside phosphotransferase family protein, partial [Ferruginibacter sp.]